MYKKKKGEILCNNETERCYAEVDKKKNVLLNLYLAQIWFGNPTRNETSYQIQGFPKDYCL